jgi:hypothetical protein
LYPRVCSTSRNNQERYIAILLTTSSEQLG